MRRSFSSPWLSSRPLAGALLHALAVLALTAAATVSLVRLAPGFGVDERTADASLGGETRAAIEQQARSQTLFSGHSAAYDAPVRELVLRRWQPTLSSVAVGLALAWSAAFAFALSAFLWRLRAVHFLADLVAAVLLALPAALVGLAVFLQRLGVAVAIAAAVFPVIYRPLRNRFEASASGWLVVAGEARGLARWRIALAHILLPARAELATLAALSLKWGLSAAIPAEVFGGQAGLGQLVWKAAEARDVALLVPLTLATAALVQAAQLAATLASRPEATRA